MKTASARRYILNGRIAHRPAPTPDYEASLEIDGVERECVIEYDYEPGERATRHEPGCDATVSILAVYVAGTVEDVSAKVAARDLVRLMDDIAEWRAESDASDDDDRRYEDAKDRRLFGRDE